MPDRAQPASRRVRTVSADIVVPGTWWKIPLQERARREKSVKALLSRQFADTQAGAGLRHQTEQALLSATHEAAAHRGVALWISTEQVSGAPLPMSLLMTALDPFHVRSFDHAVEQLSGRPGVATTTMRPGRVLRHSYRRIPGAEVTRVTGLDAPATRWDDDAPTVQADYWMERPDGHVTQLAFTSPLVRYESALLELFESVVDSATWQNAERTAHREEDT